MKLSSLIDDYNTCASRLFAAIEAEDTAAIRELDIRMSWFRNIIRDFPAASAADRRLQIEFFLDVLTKTTDQDRDVPPLADLRKVVDRMITELAEERAATRRDAAAGIEAWRAESDWPDRHALAMIENSNLWVAVLDRDLRYRYASPAIGRYYGVPPESFRGLHVIDMIGRERFEKRARAYFERCLAGEDLRYCYYIDSADQGERLVECRMLTRYGPDDRATGAIVVVSDLTDCATDPVELAEANRI